MGRDCHCQLVAGVRLCIRMLHGAVVPWALAAAVLCAAPTTVATSSSPLGPGLRAWNTARPGAHGLSAADLSEAAKQLATAVPMRECLLVARHGLLVHESYMDAMNSSSLVFVDSIGKTLTALIVGAAAAASGATSSATAVDIDRLIWVYGVKPIEGADWG